MTKSVPLEIKCEDFLKENRHVYAHKAKRKKIAIVSVEATNRDMADVRLLLSASQLIAAGESYDAESPAIVLRKLSEFTWDFLLYTIIDFHPVTAAIEAFVFMTGPLYNRRLRRQLKLLSDGEIILKPGECKRALLAFRGVSKTPNELRLSYCCEGDERRQVQCSVG
jgi:hypothetical protein